MDLKKVFDQTVRELKREVNKKVLKVPEIEVKVLEATSNEPWGPHGTIMSDIAQATRNFNEYQMIMGVLWKRLTDTGRNWRHVYKSLTVLEFLVANGAERIIDELREHTYQIQTLVDFQYLEPSGKDQGINVRKKAQTLVVLINDKERIREVRQKAAANRDKYRGVSSSGMSFRPSSYSSTTGGYSDREDDRYGGNSSRGGGREEFDSYGGITRDGDRYRDDDHSGRDRERYKDDGYGGDRERVDDGYSSKGVDRPNDKYEGGVSIDRDRGYDDDDRYSSRQGKARVAPPSYDDAFLTNDQEDESSRGVAAAVARAQSSQSQGAVNPAQSVPSKFGGGGSYFTSQVADDFDDFDPRGNSGVAAPPASQPQEDFFGQTAPAATYSLGVTPTLAPTAPAKSTSGIEDLFGDVSFQAAFPASSAPVSKQITQGPREDLFGAPAFQVVPSSSPHVLSAPVAANLFPQPPSSSPDMVSAQPPGNLFQQDPTPPSSGAGDAFQLFGLGNSTHNVGESSTGGNIFATPTSFAAFDSAPSNATTGSIGDFFQGTTSLQGQALSNQPFSSNLSLNNRQPFGNQSLSSNPPALGTSQVQSSSNGEAVQPQQQPKKAFAPPKSALWADTLSTGLVDLNIAGPKVNPLADLGIQLTDATLRNELWGVVESKNKNEKRSSLSTSSMGAAMGSGSGLGRAAASTLPPPLPPPTLMNVGRMSMAPGMGMNPGMGMAPGMGMNPGMGMGMGQGMGMAPNMGMGSYSNQQYSGYR